MSRLVSGDLHNLVQWWSLLDFLDLWKRCVLLAPFSILLSFLGLIRLCFFSYSYDGVFHRFFFVLFRVNITFGENEERTLLSGTYTVKDIFCRICGQILGWKYVIPFIPSSLSIGINT